MNINTDTVKQTFHKEFMHNYLIDLGYNHVLTASTTKMSELFKSANFSEQHLMFEHIFSKCRIFRLGKTMKPSIDGEVRKKEFDESFIEITPNDLYMIYSNMSVEYYFYSNEPNIQEEIKNTIFMRLMLI